MKHLRRWAAGLATALLGIGCGSVPSSSEVATARQAEVDVPANFIDSQVGAGLVTPTAMELTPDGRVLVAEQGGTLRVIKDGALLTTPFLILPVDATGERGLIGVTVDPSFATNGFVYVYYTVTSTPRHNRISRFTANGEVVAPGSEVVLFELDELNSSYHNGGGLRFGTDGKLYVGVGDNVNGANAQSVNSLMGKILRLNKDGSIPSDNPFPTASGKNRAIWAMGLRNPFTFAFQPGTGRLMINDVGQDSWEEINDGVPGANYGWPGTEGPTNDSRYRAPFYAYEHSNGCAVVGGAFYNPPVNNFPSQYVGKYFFADLCSEQILALNLSDKSATEFAQHIPGPVDMRVGPEGALYYLARNSGEVRKIIYAVNAPPSIASGPSNQVVAVGENATFSVSASGSPPLSYQWQWSGVDIPTAKGASYTLGPAELRDSGAQLRVRVTNAFGSAVSPTATLTVVNGSRPNLNMTAPALGSFYSGGETIAYSATANDPDQGALPGSAFTWRVDFHHDEHFHPFMPDTPGSSGSFTPAVIGETSASVYYRVHLTVRDSTGLTRSTFRDIRPRRAQMIIQSDPPGLGFNIDGQPRTTPRSIVSVVGVQRNISIPRVQVVNHLTYEFESWSDGGAISHDVITPSMDTTYTARFRRLQGLRAEYFNSQEVSGTPVIRTDPTVDFNWGTGSPAPGIRSDAFSVRWTGRIQPVTTEAVTFILQSNDGARLWVNDQMVIDNWTHHSALDEKRVTIPMQGGTRPPIRLEYYDSSGNAQVRLSWSSASRAREVIPNWALVPPTDDGSGTGLWGNYYAGTNLNQYRWSRIDSTVDMDLGLASPDPSVPQDGFSVHWTGEIEPRYSETYTFITQSDDGVRLFINDTPIINNWTNHTSTENRGTIDLVAGTRYRIRVEAYDQSGPALTRLFWASLSQAREVVPRSRLYPTRRVPLGVTVTGVSTGKPYRVSVAGLGAYPYFDRTYKVDWVSTALVGGAMIQSSIEDRYVSAAQHLRFSVDRPARVFVAFDGRATAFPAWLTDGTWTWTNESLTSTDRFGSSVLRRNVFAKTVPAGTVTLGGNLAPAADTQYIVIVQSQ